MEELEKKYDKWKMMYGFSTFSTHFQLSEKRKQQQMIGGH